MNNTPTSAGTSPAASLDLLSDLVARARRAGADSADALLVEHASLGVTWRQGEAEQVRRAEAGDLGLRVLVGKRQATVSSSDRSPAALAALVERTVAMAKAVPEDQFCGLADPDQIARSTPDLDLHDPIEPGAAELREMARALEEVVLSVKGVTKAEGCDADWSGSHLALVASNGFAQHYRVSGYGISASCIAGTLADGMETGSDYSSAIYKGDLRAIETIGRTAGERAVKRLGARKVKTAQVPIVFDPRAARSLLGHLAGAINGNGIARGTSFLKDQMGKAIFSSGISVVDDPHRRRGLRSRPWDAEGVANQRRVMVDKGVLTSWFLDLRSSRQLGLTSTGHAVRGTGGPPGPSPANLWMEPGTLSPEELMADIKEGLYITDLMGMGVNGVTGDYSRGAGGFWIENGKLTYPVNEVTIASNLKQMFLSLTAANDLEFRTGMDVPTLRVEGMILAGN